MADWKEAVLAFEKMVTSMEKSGDISRDEGDVYRRGGGAVCGLLAGLGWTVSSPHEGN